MPSYNTIKPKRSETPGSFPTLAAGELAFNLPDQKIWVANSYGIPQLIVDGGYVTDKPDSVTISSSDSSITITNNTSGTTVSYDIKVPQPIDTLASPTFAGITINGLNYPTIDGTANQLIITNGSGNLSFSNIRPTLPAGNSYQILSLDTSDNLTWVTPDGGTW